MVEKSYFAQVAAVGRGGGRISSSSGALNMIFFMPKRSRCVYQTYKKNRQALARRYVSPTYELFEHVIASVLQK